MCLDKIMSRFGKFLMDIEVMYRLCMQMLTTCCPEARTEQSEFGLEEQENCSFSLMVSVSRKMSVSR